MWVYLVVKDSDRGGIGNKLYIVWGSDFQYTQSVFVNQVKSSVSSTKKLNVSVA